MSTYRTEIGEDRIAFLTEAGGTLGTIADHVRSEGDVMILDNRAMQALRDLEADSDGTVDENQIWFGGIGYPITVDES